MTSCAWRLVPTKRTVLPPARGWSRTLRRPEPLHRLVQIDDVDAVPLPEMYSFIFGFQASSGGRNVRRPPGDPSSQSRAKSLHIPSLRAGLTTPFDLPLLNWKRFRAPAMPILLAFLTRESTSAARPSQLLRSSALYSTSARATARRTAPACPCSPPPATLARMSNFASP